MENKINIAEILKDCPKGMELDCTLFDDVHFDSIDKVCDIINCYIKDSHHKIGISFNKYGHYSNICKAKCVIFPKGKTTWEGFQRPFKDGDIVCTKYGGIAILNNRIGVYSKGFYSYCGLFNYGFDVNIVVLPEHLATEEEKQKLFDVIKANGYKWNSETKTLEKLSKFKVGDRIILKDNPYNIPSIRIKAVTKSQYILENEGFFYIDGVDEKYVLEDKFDINTLKPFDKVLVRTFYEEWKADFFSHYSKEADFPYSTVGKRDYYYCIPYEGNEHLCGTTNDCDEYYKTW